MEQQREIVEQLAEEFVERYRRGERPSVDDYAIRHPEHADEIREVFSALIMMERVAPNDASLSASLPETTLHLEQLGDYRILREIGRGGMGVVYEAEQLSLGRHVALKVLPTHTLLDPRQLLRFHREARAAARLHHTNIVPVYGVGEANGLHYYVMQFIAGQGLDQVLRELQTSGGRSDSALPGLTGSTVTDSGRPFWQGVARVGLQVASALDYAHHQGIVHRDVKPSNLLLDGQGNVWVTDFGLAKAHADTDDLTRSGDLLGTVRYMAPERFSGTSDVRGDIYSLGLTLYEMITLKPAFDAGDRETLINRVMNTEPLAPRRVNSKVPPDLETIVLKAIAREPEQRYQLPGELADDLGRFIDDRPIRAQRESNFQRLRRWCRRNKALAASLFSISLLLVAMTIGSSWAAVYFRQQERAMDVERGKAETAGKAIAERDRLTRQRLYFSEMQRAREAWYTRNGQRRTKDLLANWSKTDEPDLRGWEWHYLSSLLHREQQSLEYVLSDATAWSSDGKRLAIAHGNHVRIFDIASKAQLAEFKTSRTIDHLAWSPDNARIAACSNRLGIFVHDSSSGKPLVERLNVAHRAAWSPDGLSLALWNNQQKFLLWMPDGSEEPRDIEAPGPVLTLAWNGNGSLIAAGCMDGRIFIIDVETGKTRHTMRAYGQIIDQIHWQSNGPILVSAGREKVARVWNGERGVLVQSLIGHSWQVLGVAFSPDGKRVLTSDGDTARIWEFGTNKDPLVIRTPVARVGWSTDGKQVYTQGRNGFYVWDANSEQECRSMRMRSGITAGAVAWSPDGRRLVTSAGSADVGLFDPVSGAFNAMQFKGFKSAVFDLNWSANGDKLAVSGDTDIRVMNPDSGEVIFTKPIGSRQCSSVQWSREGDRLAVAGEDGTLKIWDATGNELRVIKAHRGQVRRVRWLPDGRRLVTSGADYRVILWDAETGEAMRTITKDSGGSGLAISPDGTRVAAASSQAPSLFTTWDIASGTQLATFRGHADNVMTLSWSGDGRRIASGSTDGTVRVWDALTGDEALTVGTFDGMVFSVAWDPTSQSLAAASTDGTTRVWEIPKTK